MTPGDVEHLLRTHRPSRVGLGTARAAAVLVPLRQLSQGDMDVVLTRRTDGLGSHAGQVAFPGGAVDPDDESVAAAALRELNEELGVAPNHVRVLGCLDELLTPTGFHITPVVGWVDASVALVPSPFEVARVFSLPLAKALDPAAWQEREHHRHGVTYRLWHLPHDGEDIWGATAFILRGFAELAWANDGLQRYRT